MTPSPEDVTRLLHAWSAGPPDAEGRLFELIYPDLHKLARRLMVGEKPGHSLQPTALMNEVYFRLAGARERDWESRKHFFAVAARAMRHLLRARPKGREEQVEQGLAIGELLDEMSKAHPVWCSIVELKFFAGFTDNEAADVLGLPLRSLQRQVGDPRRWLFERLKPDR